jgi:hypothetical protein
MRRTEGVNKSEVIQVDTVGVLGVGEAERPCSIPSPAPALLPFCSGAVL